MPIRLLRVRLTVRGLMVVVAILGLAFGANEMWSRRTAYLARAAEHAVLEDGGRYSRGLCLDSAVVYAGRGIANLSRGRWRDAWAYVTNAVPYVPEAARLRRFTAHHARMRWKYERAARQPWLPVAPDPPPPD